MYICSVIRRTFFWQWKDLADCKPRKKIAKEAVLYSLGTASVRYFYNKPTIPVLKIIVQYGMCLLRNDHIGVSSERDRLKKKF